MVELYKKVATSIPPDVEAALRAAHDEEEEGSRAKEAFAEILADIKLSRDESSPLCLASGIPVFYVKVPRGIGHEEIRETIVEATREATRKIPLSANAVDPVTSINTGDNTGKGFPVIHMEQTDGNLVVELLLMGSWSENEGRTYRLPDEGLGAKRDIEGASKCAVDAVKRAGGRGCPPYTVGVGVATTVEQAAGLSRRQLRRKLPDANPDEALAGLEEKTLRDINALGIGIAGLGGKTTALGVKIGASHRHTDSCFVDIALACWSNRRGKLIW
jgi:fumarate hydratase class I